MKANMLMMLDVLGLLTIAAGVAAGGWVHLGPWALVPAGALVMAVSLLWGRQAGPDSTSWT